MRSSAAIVLSLFALCLPATVAALDPNLDFYQYEYYYPPDQLGLDQVHDVVEDSDGSIWFASGRGLARFDGIEMDYFRKAEFPALHTNHPDQLLYDSRGRLLVAGRGGLTLMQDEEFSTLLDSGGAIGDIQGMVEGDGGVVWLGTSQGLWQLSAREISRPEFAAPIKEVFSLLWHGGKLLLGGRGEICVVDDDRVLAMKLPAGQEETSVRALTMHNGVLWAATRAGLFRLVDEQVVAADTDELSGVSAEHLLSDRDGNLWFAGRSQVGRIRPNGSVELPNVEDEDFGFVPEVTALLEDREGNHWHTSTFFGAGRLSDTAAARVSFSEGLLSPKVSAVAADTAGQVYVASDKGISILGDSGEPRGVALPDKQEHEITVLRPELGGGLWLGASDGLYWLASLDSPELERYLEVPVNDIWLGPDGLLLAGTREGLYQRRAGRMELIQSTEGLDIQTLFLDSSGLPWLGTSTGLGVLEEELLDLDGAGFPAGTGAVVAIAEVAPGRIVAATSEQGIFFYVDGGWIALTEANGLPPENVIDIEARGRELWIVTSAGVFHADAGIESPEHDFKTMAMLAQARYRPVQTAYCCRGRNHAASVLAQRSLVVATDDGVLVYGLDSTKRSALQAKPYVRAVQVDGSERALADAVTLPSNHSELRIDYSAIAVGPGSHVRFRYRLAGVSDTWAHAGTARSAQFINVPPGDHLFQLQASTWDGDWGSVTAELSVKRQPAFVETAAFDTLIWIAAVVSGILVIWVRFSLTERRRSELEAEISARTQDLANINEELEVANKFLRRASQTDPLTGLTNRRYLDTLSHSGRIASRVAATGVLITIDIDFFKRINDAYGHPAGDEVIRQFAGVLRSVTRESDLVARWGGEEFLAICRSQDDDYSQLLDRVCDAVSEYSFRLPNGKRIGLTCSVGCVRYPLWSDRNDEDWLPSLLELSDAALYAVKMNGRDGWALVETGPNPVVDPDLPRVGPALQEFVDRGHLTWHSSRASITPGLDDTVTRLRVLDPTQR